MGTVYRATDQLLGRTVAIKFLKDSGTEKEAQQIRLEAQILARLVHDKIVRLYDFGESEGNYFLVMEEVNGSSFASRWEDLCLHDRLRICGQVAEALDYAHLQGVVHRDVKPGNVLLTISDEAKLSDFGLSLVTDDRNDQSGTIRGTPSYMSPEQAQGKSLDHRTDLYSLGVMVYECATGELPFIGHKMSVIGQHVSATPRAPRFKNPQISSTLESLILSLLEKHPSRRPPSGNVVALALDEEAERAAARANQSRPQAIGPPEPGANAAVEHVLPERHESRAYSGERGRASRRRNHRAANRSAGFFRASPDVGHLGVVAVVAESSRRIFPSQRQSAFRGGRPCACPADARRDVGGADYPLARRALSLRSLPGVPPGRRAAAGVSAATTARCQERRPRPVIAGDGLAVLRRADRRGDRPRQRIARGSSRRSPCAFARAGHEIPG